MNSEKQNISVVYIGKAEGSPRASRWIKLVNHLHHDTQKINLKIIQGHWIGKIQRLLFLIFRKYRWYVESIGFDVTPNFNKDSIIICQDILLLPRLMREKFLIFDAREYYPAQFEDRFIWKILFGPLNSWLIENYVKECNAVITVSNGIAQLYKENFGIDSTVVYSLPEYYELDPHKTIDNKIKLVHHGNATPSRQLELLIETFQHTEERYSLDLYLVKKQPDYFKKLEKLIAKVDAVTLHPPVPFEDIIPTLYKYDVGIFTPPQSTRNLIHCLPNKLFEFVQARLAIVVSNFPDMSNVVLSNNLGVVTEPEVMQIAACINRLGPSKIDKFKQNSNRLAKDLCNSKNLTKLDKILKKSLRTNQE